MAEADQLQRDLVAAQNLDGGWGYQGGSSWTEATAFAMLALSALQEQESGTACERGRGWLESGQRVDGGWAPHPAVDTSTWVTSLALLALLDKYTGASVCKRGLDWLVRQVKPQIPAAEKLSYRIRGIEPPIQAGGGCSWFPGTAAWIGPTAICALTLSNAVRYCREYETFDALHRECQAYILARRCRDGGWNHGGARYLSENANSYPEMTGLALLALTGVPHAELIVPLARSEAFFRLSNSSEASSWLELALMKHGRAVPRNAAIPPCRTLKDKCLRLLVLSGPSKNNKVLTQA